jgi:hypothetical protein
MKSAIQAVSSPPASEPSPCASSSGARFLGIDLGAETVKLIELFRDGHGLRAGRHEILEHGKKPGPALREALERWDWPQAAGAAITGRFASQVNLRRIPTKAAQVRGYRFLFGDEPATIINLGSHGFSVLEWRADGLATFRENSPCSQGTGNFLTQLVERFSLTVGEASALCAEVQNPAPLSGRCPVILKTDMTHLANKGEERARILAGLFDAVCENVLMLLKPGASRGRVLLTGGLSRSLRVRRVIAAALARQGMDLIPLDEQAALGLEALGTALIAATARAGQIAVAAARGETGPPAGARGIVGQSPADAFPEVGGGEWRIPPARARPGHWFHRLKTRGDRRGHTGSRVGGIPPDAGRSGWRSAGFGPEIQRWSHGEIFRRCLRSYGQWTGNRRVIADVVLRQSGGVRCQ